MKKRKGYFEKGDSFLGVSIILLLVFVSIITYVLLHANWAGNLGAF